VQEVAEEGGIALQAEAVDQVAKEDGEPYGGGS